MLKTPGTFKWYKVTPPPKNEFLPLPQVSGSIYQPSVDDLGCKIVCQFLPDNVDIPASNMADLGPLIADQSVQSDVDAIIASEKGVFDIKYGTSEQEAVFQVTKKRSSFYSFGRYKN